MNRRLSLIVPAFNEERLLPSSLACIQTASVAFTAAGWATELIVCDNNSTDRTAAIAAAAGARVVFEPINQISRARNAGAAQASGDWLLFIDADSFPTREWNLLSRTLRWAAGSFIFCEKAAFQEIRGFTEKLYAAEEIDLFRRLKRVARRRGRSIVILRDHPLLTSHRKVHLYTFPEMLRFWLRTALTAGRSLRNPKDSYPWYDGRR